MRSDAVIFLACWRVRWGSQVLCTAFAVRFLFLAYWRVSQSQVPCLLAGKAWVGFRVPCLLAGEVRQAGLVHCVRVLPQLPRQPLVAEGALQVAHRLQANPAKKAPGEQEVTLGIPLPKSHGCTRGPVTCWCLHPVVG